jgi:hypothetical protein
MINSQCVILVPANNGIEPACDHALRQLERMGYPVWRVPGFAAIDAARSQLATDAVARGFEELMWIDSDIEFDPAAVERLRSHNRPLVSGLYPKKGMRALASSLLPETQKIIFGEAGGVFEIRYAATGFLFTKRQVYIDIQRLLNLPVCNQQFNKPLVPFFWPMVIDDDAPLPTGKPEPPGVSGPFKRPWYLSEDFAFSHRARQAGYKIHADSTIRLGHIGRYTYAWEDAGMALPRFGRFEFNVADAKPPKQE